MNELAKNSPPHKTTPTKIPRRTSAALSDGCLRKGSTASRSTSISLGRSCLHPGRSLAVRLITDAPLRTVASR